MADTKTGAELLETAVAAVKSGDHKAVFAILRLAPLESWFFPKIVDFLNLLLQAATTAQVKVEVLKVIFARFLKPMEAASIIELIYYIAALVTIPVEVLAYVMTTMDQTHVSEILAANLKTRKMGDGLNFALMADRLLLAMNALLSPSSWEELRVIAQTSDRNDAIRYIEGKLAKVPETAELPTWVTLEKGEENLNPALLEPVAWREYDASKPTEETVKLATHIFDTVIKSTDAEGDDVEADVIEDVIRAALTTSSTDATLQKLHPDRIFGPINAILDRECISGMPGGCRMLTCCCRDTDQSEEEEPSGDPCAWFTKECDHCGTKIADVSHALRQPVPGGGWAGCYCSVECLESSPARELSQSAILLMNRALEQLEGRGIYNRAWREMGLPLAESSIVDIKTSFSADAQVAAKAQSIDTAFATKKPLPDAASIPTPSGPLEIMPLPPPDS